MPDNSSLLADFREYKRQRRIDQPVTELPNVSSSSQPVSHPTPKLLAEFRRAQAEGDAYHAMQQRVVDQEQAREHRYQERKRDEKRAGLQAQMVMAQEAQAARDSGEDASWHSELPFWARYGLWMRKAMDQENLARFTQKLPHAVGMESMHRPNYSGLFPSKNEVETYLLDGKKKPSRGTGPRAFGNKVSRFLNQLKKNTQPLAQTEQSRLEGLMAQPTTDLTPFERSERQILSWRAMQIPSGDMTGGEMFDAALTIPDVVAGGFALRQIGKAGLKGLQNIPKPQMPQFGQGPAFLDVDNGMRGVGDWRQPASQPPVSDTSSEAARDLAARANIQQAKIDQLEARQAGFDNFQARQDAVKFSSSDLEPYVETTSYQSGVSPLEQIRSLVAERDSLSKQIQAHPEKLDEAFQAGQQSNASKIEELNAEIAQMRLEALEDGIPPSSLPFDPNDTYRSTVPKRSDYINEDGGIDLAGYLVAQDQAAASKVIPIKELRLHPDMQSRVVTKEGGLADNRIIEIKKGKWAPSAGEPILVWQSKDGTLYVSNGHHRFDALMKTNPDQRVGIRILREADDVTLQDAHDYGFLINALQGNINAVESALVLRKMPDVMDLLGHLKEMKVASGLSKLPEDLIMRVYRRKEAKGRGGAVASIAPKERVAASIGRILDYDRIREQMPEGSTRADVDKLQKDAFEDYSKPSSTQGKQLAEIEDELRGRLNMLAAAEMEFDFGDGARRLVFDKFLAKGVSSLFNRVKGQLTRDYNTHMNAYSNPGRISKVKGSAISTPEEHRKRAVHAGMILEKTKNAWENSIGASNPFLKDAVRIVKEEQAGKLKPDEARDALIKIIDKSDSHGNPIHPKPTDPQASYVPKFNRLNAMPTSPFLNGRFTIPKQFQMA